MGESMAGLGEQALAATLRKHVLGVGRIQVELEVGGATLGFGLEDFADIEGASLAQVMGRVNAYELMRALSAASAGVKLAFWENMPLNSAEALVVDMGSSAQESELERVEASVISLLAALASCVRDSKVDLAGTVWFAKRQAIELEGSVAGRAPEPEEPSKRL